MSTQDERERTRMQAALDAIEKWRDDTRGLTSRRIDELEQEHTQLREDLDELQRQLDNVSRMRDEAASTLSGLSAEYERRAYAAVLDGLKQDAETIEARSAAYQEAVEARDARVAAMLQEPDTAARVKAFEDFEKQREQVLGALPESYHDVVLQKHEDLRAELAPLFGALSAPVPPVTEDTTGVTLVASMDSVDGVPEALAVILPVGYQLHTGWDKRTEDLATKLAYRVVAAVSAALQQIGVPDAPVVYAPYEYGQEQLAIQVWLKDSDVEAPLEPALEAEIAKASATAAELKAAGLSLALTWQPPEVIAPSTTEQEG